MHSNVNTKPTPKANTTPVALPPQNHHSPSVPISVYRELAAELQATRTLLDSLTAQNQHLTQQNQHLRVEIERVVQSALQLRQVADSFQPRTTRSVGPDVPQSKLELKLGPNPRPTSRPAPRHTPPKMPVLDTPPLTESIAEPSELRHPSTKQADSVELNGWWLAVVILLIVSSAFGAGFLIVRPFLTSR